MTRQKSAAIGAAVLLIVVAATTAVALNASFLGGASASSAASSDDGVEDVPVTTTTAYDQYLEEYYAANPTTTMSTTAPLEPVVIYEYVDVPVTVPAPEIIYVPVETPAAGGSGGSPTQSPATTAPPSSTPPPSPIPAPTTTGPAPTTTAPSAPQLLEFELYGFAEITVASYGPGDSLQFWAIERDSPWLWEIQEDDGDKVKVEFFNPQSDREAKFELEIKSDGRLRLKTEGSGFPSVEEYV